MYGRLHYALDKTRSGLRTVFAVEDEYETIQAFVLTVAGFEAFEFAVDNHMGNMLVSVVEGFLLGAFFSY